MRWHSRAEGGRLEEAVFAMRVRRKPRGDSEGELRWWAPILAIVLASAVAHALVWSDAPRLVVDAPEYLEVARDLRDLRLDALHDRSPGYPVLLVLTRSFEAPTRALFLLQLVLHFLAVLLLVRLLWLLTGSRRLGVALALAASLPLGVALAAEVRPEAAAEAALALAVGATVLWLRGGRPPWLVVAALATGGAAFVRPTYQLLGPVLALVLLAFRSDHSGLQRRFRWAAATLLVVPTLLIGSFVLFNLRGFGCPGMTPLFGFNLSTRTVRVLERLPDEYATIRDVLIAHRDRALVARDGDHTASMSVWGAIPELERATGLGKVELSKRMCRANWWLIRRAPLEYFKEVVWAAGSYWMPTPPELVHGNSRLLQLFWGLVGLLFLLLFFASAVLLASLVALRLVVRPRLRRSDDLGAVAQALALAVIFYTVIVSTLAEVGSPRYRAPTELLIWFSTLLGFALWAKVACGLAGVAEPGRGRIAPAEE